MYTRIKICGITRLEDAKTAVSLGVDAIGFIFVTKSPRYIDPQKAGEIARKLPPFINKVGVFVDASREVLLSTAETSGIDTFQLHGDETPEFAHSFLQPVIKTLSVGPATDLTILEQYRVSALLLDTWDDKVRGGTGKVFDWETAKQIVDNGKRIILAGGLGPSNIAEAVQRVQPYAVDINSGVEIMPGVKNPQKMREVVKLVRG